MELFFNFHTKTFSIDRKEILALPNDLKWCWSGSEKMSITSYAFLLSEELKAHKNYFVKHCSNEATYCHQFIDYTGQYPPHDTNTIQFVKDYPVFYLEKQGYEKASYEQIMFVNLVFFQGLHYLLSDFSNFPKEEFSFALFYATWQWYHIAKRMLTVECLPPAKEKDSAKSANQDHSTCSSSTPDKTEKECKNDLNAPYSLFHNRLINENFRLAYIAINRLVEDTSYLMMMQQLPINQELDRDQSTLLENVYKFIHAEEKNFPKGTSFSKIIGDKPTKDLPLTIHPKFIEHPIMIKELISQHLLPTYDLDTAFRLGRLLQEKCDEHIKQENTKEDPAHKALAGPQAVPVRKPGFHQRWAAFRKKWPKCITGLCFDLLLTLTLLVVLPCGGTWLYNRIETSWGGSELKAFWISLAQFLIFAFYFSMRVWRPYRGLLVHLLLPRLMAGVAVGYMAFVLQDNPYHIPGYIFDIANPALRTTLALAFGFVCIILGYLYLRADTSQFTRGKKKGIPIKRALLTWLFAITISLAMGLLSIVFMTDPKISQPHPAWLGPVGWFDIHLMIFYLPLSFITGLVSQFIFEEKPLAAPTWTAESMN